jgi:hypothetical protein
MTNRTGKHPLKTISDNTTHIDTRGNPYLHGLHSPVRREIEAIDREVIGDVPIEFGHPVPGDLMP